MVLINVFYNMVIKEVFKEVKFEVILNMELFTLLSLHKGVCLVLVAVFNDLLF